MKKPDNTAHHTLTKLSPQRNLVCDLLRDTDCYYLNHHIFMVDFSGIEKIRQDLTEQGQKAPSFVAFTLFALAETLSDYPVFNSYLRDFPLRRLALYRGVDIAYTALKTDLTGSRQLTLSILEQCQNMCFRDFHDKYMNQCNSSLEGLGFYKILKLFALIPDSLRFALFRLFCKPFPSVMRKIGGTVAFTSVGKYGVDITTPLSPKSLTLSLGAIKPRVIESEGKPCVKMAGYITLTYDHRIADGAECASLGNAIRHFMEFRLKDLHDSGELNNSSITKED